MIWDGQNQISYKGRESLSMPNKHYAVLPRSETKDDDDSVDRISSARVSILRSRQLHFDRTSGGMRHRTHMDHSPFDSSNAMLSERDRG